MPILSNIAVSVYKTITAVQSKQSHQKCCVISEKPHKYKSRWIPRTVLASTNHENICENSCVHMIGLSEDTDVWHAMVQKNIAHQGMHTMAQTIVKLKEHLHHNLYRDGGMRGKKSKNGFYLENGKSSKAKLCKGKSATELLCYS